MSKNTNLVKVLLSKCLPAFLFAVFIMIGVGYLCGYKAILVNGWSAEPHIAYQSLIITYRCKQKDLEVGDFVTFSNSGKSYVTHQIVEIDYENDKIVCKGWQYNSTTEEYELQSDSQVIKYSNVVGKVIYSNYLLGKTVFTIKDNIIILFGIVGLFVLLLVLRDELSIEPTFS